MKYILMVVVGWLAWMLGIWGWAQIVGSFQHAQERGAKLTLYTIAIWSIVLGLATVLAFFILRTYFTAYLIGLGIALIRILCVREIE